MCLRPLLVRFLHLIYIMIKAAFIFMFLFYAFGVQAQLSVDPDTYAELETPTGTQVIITTDIDVDPDMAKRDVDRFKNNLPEMRKSNLSDEQFLREMRKSCLRNGRPSTLKTIFSKKILSKAGLATAALAMRGTGREMVSEFGEEYIGDFLGMSASMAIGQTDSDDPAYLTHWAEESILNPQSHFIIGGVVLSMQAGMGLARHSGLIDDLCNFYLSPKAVIPNANGKSVARKRISQGMRNGEIPKNSKIYEVLKKKVDWIRAKRTFVSGASMGAGIGLFTAIWDGIQDKELHLCRKNLRKGMRDSFENNFNDYEEFEKIKTACTEAFFRWTSTQKYADYANGTASGAVLGWAIYSLRESVGHILRNEVLDRWEKKIAADLGADSAQKLLNDGGTLVIKGVRRVRHLSKMGGPKGFMIEVAFEASTFLFYEPFTEKVWNPIVRPWMRRGAYLKDANEIIDQITDLTDLGFFEGQINRPTKIKECAGNHYRPCIGESTITQKPLEYSYKKMLSRSAEWHAFLSEGKDQTQQKWDELLRSFQPLWDGAYAYYETMIKYGDHDLFMPNTKSLDDLISDKFKAVFSKKYINKKVEGPLAYLSDSLKPHEKEGAVNSNTIKGQYNDKQKLLKTNYIDKLAWNYAHYIESLIKGENEYKNLIDKLRMIGQEQLEQNAFDCQNTRVKSKQNILEALGKSRPDIYSAAMEALMVACEEYYSEGTKKLVQDKLLGVIANLGISNIDLKLDILREDYESGEKSQNFDSLRQEVFQDIYTALSEITELMLNDKFEHYVGDQYVSSKVELFDFTDIMSGTGINYNCEAVDTFALPLGVKSLNQTGQGQFCENSKDGHGARFRNLVRSEDKMYPHEDLRVNPLYNALSYLGKPFQLNMSIEDLDAELAMSSDGKLFEFEGHTSTVAPGFNHSSLKKAKPLSEDGRKASHHKLHAYDFGYRPIDHISYQFLCGDQNPHTIREDYMFDKDWKVPFFGGNSKRPAFNPPAMGSLLPETHTKNYSNNIIGYQESICNRSIDTFQYMDYQAQDAYEVHTQINEPQDYIKKRQHHFHKIINNAYASIHKNDCGGGAFKWATKDRSSYTENLKQKFFANSFSCKKQKLSFEETNKMLEDSPEAAGSAIRYAVKGDNGKWYSDRHELAYHRVEPAFLLNKDKFPKYWQDKVYEPGINFLVDFSQRYKKQMYEDLSKVIWTSKRELQDLGLSEQPYRDYKLGQSQGIVVNLSSVDATNEEKALAKELFDYRGRTLSHKKIDVKHKYVKNYDRNHVSVKRVQVTTEDEITLNKYQKFSSFSRDEVEAIFNLASNSAGKLNLVAGQAEIKEKLSDETAALYIKHVLEKPVRSFDRGLEKDFEYGLHAGDLSVYRLFARQIWGLYKEAYDDLNVFTEGYSAETLNIAYQLLRLDYFLTISYEFLDKSRCAIDEGRGVGEICRSQTQLVVSEAYKKIISTIALPNRREFYSSIVGISSGGGDPGKTGQLKDDFLSKINNTFNEQGYQYSGGHGGSFLIDAAFKSLDAEGKDFLLDNSKLTKRYDESDYSTAFDFDTYFYKLGTRGMKMAIQLYTRKLLNDLGLAASVDDLIAGGSAEFVTRVQKGDLKSNEELIYQSVMTEAVKGIKKTFDNIHKKASWNITLNEKEFRTEDFEEERAAQNKIDHIVDQTLITIAPLTEAFDTYIDNFTGLTCDDRLALDNIYMYRTDVIKSVRCANIDFSSTTAVSDFKKFKGVYDPKDTTYKEKAKRFLKWLKK